MFFRKVVSKSGDKEYAYLKLIENYRDGDKVKQRVVANLGSLEKISPQKASRLISGLARICGLDSAAESEVMIFGTNRVLDSADVLIIRKIWEELGVGDVLENEIKFGGEKENLVALIEGMIQRRLTGADFYEEPDMRKVSAAMKLLCGAQFKLERQIFSSLQKYLVSPNLIACHLFACRLQVAKRNKWSSESIEGLPFVKRLYLLVPATTEGIPLGFKIVHVPDATTTLALLESIRQEFQVDHLVVTGTQKIFKERDFKYLQERGFGYLYAMEEKPENAIYCDTKTQQESHGNVVSENIKTLFCYSPDNAIEERFALEAKITLLESELSALSSLADNGSITAFLEGGEYAKYFDFTFPNNGTGMVYNLKEDVYRSELAKCGKYQLETNCRALSDEDIIQIYNTALNLKKDFGIISSFELPIDLPGKKSCFKGYLIVCYLALFIEGFIEMLLKKNGLYITARRALESMADIKITINKLHNFEAISITERTLEQERILEILGMEKLHEEISLEKVKGGGSGL